MKPKHAALAALVVTLGLPASGQIRLRPVAAQTGGYPAVADPLMAVPGDNISSSSHSEQMPVIAYDTKRNRYLVVWQRETTPGSGTPRDIKGVMVAADGSPTGGNVDAATSANDELAPDVAYNAATDEYLVVWERVYNLNVDHAIVARRVNASTGAIVGSDIFVTGAAGLHTNPKVVANRLAGVTNRWFVVWEDNRDAGGSIDQHIYGRFLGGAATQASPGGSPAFDFLVSRTVDNLDDTDPAATFNPATGNHLVVYRANQVFDFNLEVVRVNGGTGTVNAVSTGLSQAGLFLNNASDPEIAWNVWTGTTLAVWQDNRGGSSSETNSIYGRRLTESATVGANFEIQNGTSLNPNRELAVSPELAGGWSVSFARKGSDSGDDDYDIAARWVSADGASTQFVDVTADYGSFPVRDDRVPDAVPNPYYGWHYIVLQHRQPDADQDIHGARLSAGTYPLQSAHANFDGLGGADRTVVRPNQGYPGTLTWFVNGSAGGSVATTWGAPGDVPVAGDYDGDAKADVAVWRPEDGGWYIVQSSTGMGIGSAFGAGAEGDIPVPADYDGDGKTDRAVYRPGLVGAFYIVRSSTGAGVAAAWGTWGDIPVTGDYDGDGKADMGVWRPSTGTFFIIRSSTGAAFARTWGAAGDQPVMGDFDGDGIDDFAVFRPRASATAAAWYIIPSSTGVATATSWGDLGDLPVPADYDGDGRTDIAVWRQGSPASAFFIVQSSGGAVALPWGTALDLPIAR